MALLYVAGYARCGSTFLDSALGSRAGVFSAGELTHLFDDLSAGRPCGCGARLDDCPIWSAVLADVGTDTDRARSLTRRCEHGMRGTLASNAELREYGELWHRVFQSLRRRTGEDVIVDASKTMLFTARRANLIRQSDPQGFRVLHLTRDPRASIWSVRKGGNRIAASRRFKAVSTWRTAGTWVVANTVAERVARESQCLSVRYEDLVAHPTATLREIGALIGIDFDQVGELLEQGAVLPTGHGISGNRLRGAGSITLKPDRDWISSASGSVRLAATLTGPLAKRYGYTVTRRRPTDRSA